MKVQYFFIVSTVFYLFLCLLLYCFQRNFIYFPTKKLDHPYQELTFNNKNESIKVIVLNQGQQKSILYFGGNAEAVVNNAPSYLEDFPNHTVYLVNYRGYGGSSGSPEEQGLYSDALTVFDQIKIKHNTVSIIGRSLGSGVATYLAANRNIENLVLVTPYDSIENVAKSNFPIFPIPLLLKDKFDSVSRISKIKAKTLIIYAEKDTVIPFKHVEYLIDAFPPMQRSVERIKNAGHNDLSNKAIYRLLIKQFLPAIQSSDIILEGLSQEYYNLVLETSEKSLIDQGLLTYNENLVFQINRLLTEAGSGASFDQYFEWVGINEVKQIVGQINKLGILEVTTIVTKAIKVAFPNGVPENDTEYRKSTHWTEEQVEKLDYLYRQFEPYDSAVMNRLAKHITTFLK